MWSAFSMIKTYATEIERGKKYFYRPGVYVILPFENQVLLNAVKAYFNLLKWTRIFETAGKILIIARKKIPISGIILLISWPLKLKINIS